MRNIIPALLLATAAVFAVPADAATKTYTGYEPYVPFFNPELGTLQSVSLSTDWFAIIGFRFSAYRGPDEQVSYPVINAKGAFGYDLIGKADYSGSYQSEYANPEAGMITLRGSSSVFRTTDLGAFTQPYALPFVSNGLPELTFQNGSAVQSIDIGIPGAFGSGVRYTVIYDYVDAIPEPATWAMMLVGFAMVGATARYRRRKVAATFA
jgi:hypothetical protein